MQKRFETLNTISFSKSYSLLFLVIFRNFKVLSNNCNIECDIQSICLMLRKTMESIESFETKNDIIVNTKKRQIISIYCFLLRNFRSAIVWLFCVLVLYLF